MPLCVLITRNFLDSSSSSIWRYASDLILWNELLHSERRTISLLSVVGTGLHPSGDWLLLCSLHTFLRCCLVSILVLLELPNPLSQFSPGFPVFPFFLVLLPPFLSCLMEWVLVGNTGVASAWTWRWAFTPLHWPSSSLKTFDSSWECSVDLVGYTDWR